MDWKTLFLTANGRIGKRDFWIGFAILVAASILLGWIPILGFVVVLAVQFAWICVGSKRLHDMGKTGWLMLLPVGVGLATMILSFVVMGGAMMAGLSGSEPVAAGAMMAGAGFMGLLGLVAFVVNIAFLFWLGLSNGDPGDNLYGPPPVSLTGGTASPPMVS